MIRRHFFSVTCFSAVFAATAALAHHGWNSFDTRHAYYASGTITDVRWGNPHSEVHMTVEATTLPPDFRSRELPPGADATDGNATMASARPYEGEHQELHLVLAGPSWMARWGLERPLEVGETIEVVGYLGSAEDHDLRPVMFWLEDGQGVWQQLTAFPGPSGTGAELILTGSSSMNGTMAWLLSLFGELERSPLGEAVRMTPSLYPVLMAVHVLGIALLVGPAVAVDLRLLGLGRRSIPVTTAARLLLPLSHVGFAVVAASGVLMFCGIATVVGGSAAAPWKFGLIALALLNILVFHKGIYRHVAHWDNGVSPPRAARLAATVSLLSWSGAVFGGRFLAY